MIAVSADCKRSEDCSLGFLPSKMALLILTVYSDVPLCLVRWVLVLFGWFLLFFLFEIVSLLCSPNWPGANRDLPASVSHMY